MLQVCILLPSARAMFEICEARGPCSFAKLMQRWRTRLAVARQAPEHSWHATVATAHAPCAGVAEPRRRHEGRTFLRFALAHFTPSRSMRR